MSSDIEKIVEIGARALATSDEAGDIEAIFAATVHDGDCTKQCHTCLVCLADEYRKQYRRLISALTAAGYAVVPRDPTEAMQIAGATEHVAVAYTIDHKGRCTTPGLIWRAMVETFSPVKD